MALDKRLLADLRKLDDPDLRRVLIFVGGLLRARGDDATETFVADEAGPVSYRLEPVNCGKPGCTKCPHGPYWYAYWREDGKVRSRYIGPELPEGESRA